MKLERSLGRLAVGLGMVGAVTALAGCGGSPGRPGPASTTELRAAELPGADAPVAPRVGKTQREDVDADAEPAPAKADPVRQDDRPGGGFSGYK